MQVTQFEFCIWASNFSQNSKIYFFSESLHACTKPNHSRSLIFHPKSYQKFLFEIDQVRGRGMCLFYYTMHRKRAQRHLPHFIDDIGRVTYKTKCSSTFVKILGWTNIQNLLLKRKNVTEVQFYHLFRKLNGRLRKSAKLNLKKN